MADSAKWDKPKLSTAREAVRRKKSQRASDLMRNRAHMTASSSDNLDGLVGRKQAYRGAQKNKSARGVVARARAGTLKKDATKKK